MYTVKEIYTTLQGEGAHTGRAAVFLRFAGCNLWSGLERDRGDAACQFCDTDFVGTDGPGGGKFAGGGGAGQCRGAMLGSGCWKLPLTPAPLPQGERGCAPPSSIAEKGTPSQPARLLPLPSRERAGVRGGKG